MNEYAFLKATKPSVSKGISRSAKVQWHGLNMNAHADTGYIVDGRNFYVTADGTLRAVDVPCELKWWNKVANNNKPENYKEGDITPLGFMGIDGKLFFVYNVGNDLVDGTATNVDIVRITDVVKDDEDDSYTCNVSHAELSNKVVSLAFSERSLARYNVWTGGSDIVSGEYKPRLLVYPDKVWLDFKDEWEADTTIIPISRYKIMKKTTVKTRVSQKTYNTEIGAGENPNSKGEWKYNLSDGTYSYFNTPDGEGWHDESNTSEEVYGYADEPYDISGPPSETKTDVTYSVEETGRPDNTTFKMLTVETTTTTTTVAYEFITDENAAVPGADFISPWNNRIFGVDGTKIFASAAGSYVDYDLDTADDFDGNNAWYSATQSGGDFTHICTYGGRPIAFKADMLYELYNDKNPFRIKEISRIGTFNGSSVCEVNSTLFYASKDGIYAYGGSYPRSVSEGFIDKARLEDGKFTKCVAGSYDGKYFVRVPLGNNYDDSFNPILVFDTATGTWSISALFEKDVAYFAECDGKFFAVLNDGKIYHMNSGNKAGLHWYFETPVITEGTADRKVLEKVQMLVKFHGSGSVNVSVKYDNGAYEDIGTLEKNGGVHPLYCKVRKSDHAVRYIKFDCVGDVEILTFEQFLSQGGDR